MINETQIREVVDNVLAEEGLKNFIKIFEKEHNIFRGSHDKMAVPPVIEENYYTSKYLNERLWDVDGKNLYYDKGWIGLGKKPTVPLDILGDILAEGNLGLTGDVSLDGAAIFNESGLGKNFRIESLNDEYAFFLNAADDLIGIREQYPTALVHIHARAEDTVPCLNLEAGINGELVTPDGQVLRIGHWNSGTKTFTERMKMDSDGKIYISYLTNGSVGFFGAGGEIKHDNDNFFWDAVNKRLGLNLGEIYPLETLHLSGKLRLDGNSYSLISNNASASRQILQLRALSAISDGAGINLYGDADSTYPGQIKFFTNNLTAMTIDAAQLVTIEDLSITTPVNIYNLSHDLFADYLAAEHLSLPNTIANVLTDHTKAVHDALGLSHDSLSDVSANDHHNQLHAASHNLAGGDELNHDLLAGFVAAEHLSLPNTIGNVLSDHTKAVHDALGIDHGSLSGRQDDDHSIYILADGTRAFTGVVLGVDPTLAAHLATKNYVDNQLGGVNEFTELIDTPGSYVGQAGKFVKVNVTPDGLEFADLVAGDLPSHTHVKVDITDTPWAWADVLKTGASLADLPTRSHGDLQGVSADQHHPQSHTLASHSSKAHNELTGIGVNDHHSQAHVLDGGDHSISGKTPGHFLKALTATTFGFAAHGLTYSDVGAAAASHGHVRSNISDFWSAAFWANIPDKPSTYPPSSHTHVKMDITDTPWAWTDVLKTGSNLTDLATRQHAGLTNITSDQHHAQIHAPSHHVGGGDLINHDSLTGFVAAEHKSLPNTIAQVLSDHNLAAHTALGLFDQSSDVDHDLTTGYVAAEHLPLPNTIANVLSNHTKAVHDALGINADLLDGYHLSTTRNSPNTVPVRDSNGYLQLGWINTTSGDAGTNQPDRIYASYDGYIRYYTPANFGALIAPEIHELLYLTHIGIGTGILAVSTGQIYIKALGIANNCLCSIDDLDAAVGDYCKLTSLGIQGRSSLEVLSDIGAAATNRKLDDFGTPDDNTDLNASTSRHGLLKKLGGGTVNFLRADGAWAAPSGGASVHSRAPVNLSHTDDNTWRDVDVTAYTSASATFVLLNLHCAAYDGGTYSVTLETREKGEAFPNGRVGATSGEDLSTQDNSFVICKLDANQVFQYKCQTSSAPNTNALITVIGWIE